MANSDPPWLQSVADAFELGRPLRLARLQIGQIQQTWRLETTGGCYICQSLHPAFAKAVTEDAQTVSAYLRRQGFVIPKFLATRTGELHFEGEGGRWRVMTCLPGISHRTAPDPAYLRQAGQAAGKMHRLLAGFEHRFQFQLPNFHNTPQIHRQLQACPCDSKVEAEWAYLLESVPALLLPAGLPRQIIHGDLKLTNFLFDERGGVVGIVDLDTFMYHNLYVELGDALRSWCTAGETFDLQLLEASLSGYAQSGAFEALDSTYLVAAVKLITLELAMRYLNDYFDDCYFQWDPTAYPNRRAHNLARCRRQIAVYRDLLDKEGLVHRIVQRLLDSASGGVRAALHQGA
ncbi:MAG: aminoglycoside phosphotransferase family protein [Aphanocapsa lilacina HA4352-LM1]|jgi:Ser/Thr protein kinase RdoA (MazF antagonist)|nr:aminoglycoside phosphotransferase family protein [Aphanocapsa lilacina HA4352-LM1]